LVVPVTVVYTGEGEDIGGTPRGKGVSLEKKYKE